MRSSAEVKRYVTAQSTGIPRGVRASTGLSAPAPRNAQSATGCGGAPVSAGLSQFEGAAHAAGDLRCEIAIRFVLGIKYDRGRRFREAALLSYFKHVYDTKMS